MTEKTTLTLYHCNHCQGKEDPCILTFNKAAGDPDRVGCPMATPDEFSKPLWIQMEPKTDGGE